MPSKVIYPQGVCSREFDVDYDENGVITSCKVLGGCQGNLQGICKLIVGMKVKEVAEKLSGIKCRGSRNGETSCPDQLANGLKEIL